MARGKKVLFVCEKRAAIDVVYYRLKQQGLDQLCSLIHDSQTDKKGFILNLKTTFEQFTKKVLSIKEAEQERNEIISKINSELALIKTFHTAMQSRLEDAGLMISELLEVLVDTKQYLSTENTSVTESLTGYKEWLSYGETVEKISLTVKELSGTPFYSKHPFRYLSEKVIYSEKTAFELKEELTKSVEILSEISERLEMADIPESSKQNIHGLKDFLINTSSLIPFKENDRLDLLTKNSELNIKLSDSIQLLENLKSNVIDASEKNMFWINKFSQTDAANAYEIVLKNEKSFFSFLNSDFRRTRKSIRQSYDFSKHQIKPSLTQLVGNLKTEYDLAANFNKEKQNIEQFFRLGDLFELVNKLKVLEVSISAQVVQYAKLPETTMNTLKEIQQINQLLEKLNIGLNNTIENISDKNLEIIEKILQNIIDKSKDLTAIAPLMKELNGAHDTLKKLILNYNYSPIQIKGLLAKSSIDKFYNINREVKKIEADQILYQINKVKKLYKDFLRVNAAFIIAKQQERLNKVIQKSEMSMAGRSADEKEEKRSLVEGRKILDNEFGKSIRFKSIRDLATSDSGQIIREIKPVWLMSPLSVSDTLPLKTEYFDVIIFDEASQITLEEGIPPIYRASQAIIVGDEMQMPPSNYFSSSTSDPDDLWAEDEEEGKLLTLDADSFLTQGARKFPSVMLGWHYRSRHESLIGFSNASFYRNELLTIPDAQDNHRDLKEISADKTTDAVSNTSLLLERPISYHFLKQGIYESRSNIAEADYIAELIRTLLAPKNGLSIGVVAFSMEQQGEIENAVQRLCNIDKEFEKVMEEEYKRVEDNQFVGIFFKNLENVQGDERDIIIMSTCYGYDPKGKMIMNFGPINRRGGEKRLNVIFSRAKKHMCVVSSIKFTDIKNEYNEGANYFRKYLQYSEQASKGNMEMANLVLQSVIPDENKKTLTPYKTVIIDQISEALKEKGYFIKTLIGQSHFKCHIGIKNTSSDTAYLAGVLIDDVLHYSSNDLLEQYLFKPELLRYSGWKIIQVFSKDWYEDHEKVVKKIVALIETDSLTNQIEEIIEKINVSVIEIPKETEEKKETISENQNSLVRLFNIENNSNKFWEVFIESTNLIISYGKIDTKGQRIIKPFDNLKDAENEKGKLVLQKLNKGYKYQ